MPIIEIDGFKVYSGVKKSLIIESDRIQECMAFYLRSDFDGIALVKEHGYKLKTVDFLADYPFVKHISISEDINDIEAIYNLKHLSSLILSGKNRVVDFSNLPFLKELKVDWSRFLVNLKDCTELEQVSLYKYNPKNNEVEDLSKTHWLKTLEITQSSVSTMEWLKGFNQLEDVSLNYCSKLEYLSGLENSSGTLHKLMFDHCKQIQNHQYVQMLLKLKTLGYNDCGVIKTLSFINRMTDLERFMFVGTTIVDGDLTPCLRLKYAGFNNKKHYSHTSEQINSLIKR
ncbi:hypothetical protein FBD94_25755 [Pedobacter hiemivivus]|uniref:Leucine-rich repeat domain-containing protein n=1 Tax=Pedobacter hiemivivus TaxID=2530454 RepID=A0A4U1FVL3_9SPHI|nr:hypothetical protein [Pedobacter hiemivivus]TKC54875.1 hypothetical protein FBD94_25755 [Pedobacter hiemivivus]